MTVNEFKELQREIAEARRDLLDMLLYEDRQEPENIQKANASADKVSQHLAQIRVDPRHQPTFDELIMVWESFKHTRACEIIPALLAGDHKTADHLAAGIQKERLNQMYAIIRGLEQH